MGGGWRRGAEAATEPILGQPTARYVADFTKLLYFASVLQTASSRWAPRIDAHRL